VVGAGWPQPSRRLSPWPPPYSWLGGGVGAPPPHFIKGAQGRRKDTQFHEPGALLSAWCAVLSTSTSLSLLCGLPKGCVGLRSHHSYTPSCYRVSKFHPTTSTLAILVGSEIPGVIVITVRVQVRGGASCVASELLHQVLQRP
jgi:hypothetical protein